MDQIKKIGIVLLTITLALLTLNHFIEDPFSTEPVAYINISDTTNTSCGPIEYTEEKKYVLARQTMVEKDLAGRDINDEKVLTVMSKIPRQEYMPENTRSRAYYDSPHPIGYGQTISQPYIVALMSQSLNLTTSDRVLEVGTGSGYQAAVLAEIVDEVYTIEIIPALAKRSDKTLKRMGYCNTHVKNSDGHFGWKEKAPFDAIIITAAVDHVPPPLIDQLADGGKLILPLGSPRYHQTLTLIEKKDGELTSRYITNVRFVPMTGEPQISIL